MILQVNKMYDPTIGGVETVVKQYAKFLSQFEEVVVLCINDKFSFRTKYETIDGIRVVRCASFGIFLSMPISFVFFWKLFLLSRESSCIHFHEPFPLGSIGSLLIDKRKKIFVTWHSDIIRQKYLRRGAEFFQKILCQKSFGIISTSDRLTRFSSVLSLYKEKVTTIPLGFDDKSFAIEGVCEIVQDLPKDYVLFLGRLSYYKGVFVLLEAINKLDQNIPIVIVGNGELRKDVSAAIKEGDGNIIFIDRFVTEFEKNCLLKNCKIFVFPSIYPSEAFGIMQLEAMSFSKPVINTNLKSGVPWVSRHNISGLTVEPSNSTELAKSITRLYTDQDLYNVLSIGARSSFNKKFTKNIVEKKLYNFYFRKKIANS
jgi:glycosyltransferase involved in cell wall biosynthesis